MKLKVVVHEAEEGGYWAEVPAIPGCATEGDSFEELFSRHSRESGNLYAQGIDFYEDSRFRGNDEASIPPRPGGAGDAAGEDA